MSNGTVFSNDDNLSTNGILIEVSSNSNVSSTKNEEEDGFIQLKQLESMKSKYETENNTKQK